MMARDIRYSPPGDDQGSEADAGFDYQRHCIATLCVEALCDNSVNELVCEYHQDAVELRIGGAVSLCQIKKKESSAPWTLAAMRPAIRKLISQCEFRNVTRAEILSSGRPDAKSEPSLANLVQLLDVDPQDRCDEWERRIDEFVKYFAKEFGGTPSTELIRTGLSVLKVRLDLPTPDGIEFQNVAKLSRAIKRIWGVELSYPTLTAIYGAIYDKVRRASSKPKMPLSAKRITQSDLLALVRGMLGDGGLYASSTLMVVDTLEKLRRASLERKLPDALGKRMDGLQVKYEFDLSSGQWEDLKDEVAADWDVLVKQSSFDGPQLWRQLRQLLTTLSESWERTLQVPAGRGLAEGVFFDMVAVCDADFGG